MSTSHKIITIIGGGLVGTSIACITANKLLTAYQTARREGFITPDITIQIVDPAENLGRGIPYARYSNNVKDDNVAMYNQPNNRMSFDPNDVHALSKTIDPQSPESIKDKFTSRAQTGDYAEEALRKAKRSLADANIGINIQHIQEKVIDIQALGAENTYALKATTDNNSILNANKIIIADGHQYNNHFEEFNTHDHFFGRYTRIEEVHDIIKKNTGPVGIRGTSQSMIDWLRVLEHSGYQGQIYTFSRNNNMPWLFDPKEHPIENDEKSYEMQHLDIHASIEDLNKKSLNELTTIFEAETQSAQKQGIGKGILLARTINTLAPKIANAPYAKGSLVQFFYSLTANFGNPTPKFNIDILDKLKTQKRLHTIAAPIGPKNVIATDNGFTLKGENAYQGLKLGAFFDAAMFARSAVNENGQIISPLLRRLHKKNLLKLNPSSTQVFVAGEQNHTDLSIAKGPSTSLWKWGIESFRDENERIATELTNSFIPSNE